MRLTVTWELDVRFKRGCLRPESPDLAQLLTRREPQRTHRLLAVLDGGLVEARPGLPGELRAYCQARGLVTAGEPVILPGGELIKEGDGHARLLHERFEAARLDRHSHVLAVGGGALLDAAGFAAATFHRGVRLTRLPTTVLSQADSGVGVKCGVNAMGQKNLIGAFYPPFGVLMDADFLSTLPPRERSAGCAEAVKVALVRDAVFFQWLCDQPDALDRLEEITRRSALLHLDHILRGGDPFEQGRGRPLDFGHWAAHKLEMLSGRRLRHGEAVAIGMALDVRLSVLLAGLHESEAEAIFRLLRHLGLPLWHEAVEGLDAGALDEFRRHLGGDLSITLLRQPGAPVEVSEAPEAAVREAIARLKTCASPEAVRS